jgi:alpha-beta hydrolase superfamily lysophospholipase
VARRFNLSYPTRAVVTCRTASVRYKAAGLTDVTIRTYPGARHEILDETNRNEVVAELTTWLDPVVSSSSQPS